MRNDVTSGVRCVAGQGAKGEDVVGTGCDVVWVEQVVSSVVMSVEVGIEHAQRRKLHRAAARTLEAILTPASRGRPKVFA